VLFGMAAMVVDFGFIYLYQNQLNASTQAAVLAGAWAMSQPGATTTSVTSEVTTYGGTTSNDNADADIKGVSLVSGYPKFKCLATLTSVYGLQCYGPSNSNAVAVAQQVKVPLFFFAMFGGYSATLTSTATAAMKGSPVSPYNVAIIVDSTHSMNDTDSDSNCSSTRISCALNGIQILLKGLSPCLPTEASCGGATNGNVANSVDRVTLLTFPPVTTATAADDYNCSGATPSIVNYTYPLPATSTYQVFGFSSDYRTSDSATSLNSTSNIVAAVGGKTGCAPIQAPARIVLGQMLGLQILIGGRIALDLLAPQFLHQPILMRPVIPLHPPLGLRRVGGDDPDSFRTTNRPDSMAAASK